MMMFAFMFGIKKDCDLTLASIFSPLVGCGQCVDSWGKKRFVFGIFWFSVEMMMMKPHPHWLSLLGSEAALPCWWRSSPESFSFIQTIIEHNYENTWLGSKLSPPWFDHQQHNHDYLHVVPGLDLLAVESPLALWSWFTHNGDREVQLLVHLQKESESDLENESDWASER